VSRHQAGEYWAGINTYNIRSKKFALDFLKIAFAISENINNKFNKM
jgi:hypothetical protein